MKLREVLRWVLLGERETTMTGDQYVASIVIKYRPPQLDPQIRPMILPIVQAWAGKYLVAMPHAGSYAKVTAVRGGTDVDFLISLRPETPGTLEELYNGLYSALARRGMNPRKQNVSVGLVVRNSTVDLVPARLQFGGSGDHSLYVRRRKTWQQTNIAKQIDVVRNSGRINEIRAVKIWRQLHGLDFPSFYLELTVIDALHSRTAGLAQNVFSCLVYIAQNLEIARVVDPANSNNIISEDLTQNEKRAIAIVASESTRKATWGEILW